MKYGRYNGEVYAEVAATRLLWALGFPADRNYPVRVVCAGCSEDPARRREDKRAPVVFDPATVKDAATYAAPHAFAAGVPHVLVNGQFVVRDGGLTGARPGHILRPARKAAKIRPLDLYRYND